MNRIVVWSITVALAGFLFGFDTVVISGANEPIKQLWDTSPLFHGTFIMSMALWGTVFGSLFGGIPTKKIGRKKTLFWIGILFFISAIGSALAQDPYSFSFFRFIGGVGVGISSVAAPIYISEITSKENRGKMGGLYQFWLVFGILIAFVSNWLLKGFDGANDWRWMLGVEAIPAFIYTLMVFKVPNSPRWLALHKKDDTAALKVLELIHPKEQAKEQLLEIKLNLNHSKKSENLFQRKYSKILWLGFFIALFNQLSGINFVLYYAPEILEQAGLGGKESIQFDFHWCHKSNIYHNWCSLIGQTRQTTAYYHWVYRIYYKFSYGGVMFSDGARFYANTYFYLLFCSIPRNWTRRRNLGIYFRNLSKQHTCIRTILGR